MNSHFVRAGVPVAALTLLVAACSGDDTTVERPAGTWSTGTADGTCRGDDVAVGDDGATIAEIAAAAAAENGLSSLHYRVLRDGDVIASGVVADEQGGVPVELGASFRVGNIAFGYMGTLLLLLEEEGLASIDDPISRWLPERDLPNGDEVTLRMLVENTSGYPDYVPNDAFVDAFEEDPFRDFTADELLAYGFELPPWYEPGESWSYSHTNYVLLGEALEAIGGADLATLLQERVIDQLGLDDTAAVVTSALPAPVLRSFSTERDVFEETTFWNPSWQTARGGVVVSTICDVATSAAAVGTGKLLDDASIETLLAPNTVGLGVPEDCPVCAPLTDDFYYALGVIVADGWVMQTPLFGGSGGAGAYLPDEDLSVALLATSGPDTEPNVNIAQRVLVEIAEAITPEAIPSR